MSQSKRPKQGKNKIRQKLTKAQVRDMMENKLKAKTVPSKKKYNRKKSSENFD